MTLRGRDKLTRRKRMKEHKINRKIFQKMKSTWAGKELIFKAVTEKT